jgi:hypothetical protein
MRFRGGNFEPIEPINLLELLGVPDGAVVLFRIEEPEVGTGQAIAAAARRGPHLEPGDIEALEAAIAEGRQPAGVEGCFDEDPPPRKTP